MIKTISALISAFLMLISSFAVPDSNFKFLVDRAAVDVSATAEVSFDTITAEEMLISEAEKQSCREWFNKNILTTEKPAYNFNYGLKSFRGDIKNWSVTVGKESAAGEFYKGGKTTYIELAHKENGLAATVEATIFEDNATCEWTVFIRNTASENSPVIRNFYAADCVIPVSNCNLYYSKGSEPAPDDFELVKQALTSVPVSFSANGGRTESVLPYFNISGKNSGVVFSVGWSGQWFASMSRTLGGVNLKAKQEKLSAYLEPAEEIRSPLVSLTFYNNSNALKGFNSFRKWTTDCLYPDGVKAITTMGIGIETPGTTVADMVNGIKNSPVEFTDSFDAYWIDAGWYPIKNDWGDSVGSWYPDPERYPEGFSPIADAAAERGLGLLLWYEPERCAVGTQVYNDCIGKEGWIIESDDTSRNMVNFANEGALEYITDVILESLKANKVTYFRIDSIPEPLPFWQRADEKWGNGRKGITENHYVANFYGFLDTLVAEIPDLKIDNCCSGGKRIDIEMSRRSIPLWRSDFNCLDGEGKANPEILQGTQAQTYGISFWVPINGTCAYLDGEYADRTNIIPCTQRLGYQDVRAYMTGNYYPLCYAGLDTSRYQATQYDVEGEGFAVVYKRENVEEDMFTLRLNGLDPDKTYVVYDYDSPDEKLERSGKELMNDGLELQIEQTPKAVIIMYGEK